jgi:hypothetical protein
MKTIREWFLAAWISVCSALDDMADMFYNDDDWPGGASAA